MNARRRDARAYGLVFLRGIAMGAADIVPGVSGGTIALITGIYEELVQSIRAVRPEAIRIWWRDGLPAAWRFVNGTFLLVLAAGILVSVLSLARVIHWLLESWPIHLWSFFFGLILYSAVMLAREIRPHSIGTGICLLFGALMAWAISSSVPLELQVDRLTLFLAGSVAICAMILPGISGSFMLVLMGMYGPVIAAVVGFDIALLAVFALGCLTGLLLFAQLLGWLLEHYAQPTMAVLTGFMLGSLHRVWPWKQTLSTRIDRHGEEVPLLQQNVLPWTWEQASGADAFLLPAIACLFAGMLLVWLMSKWSAGRHERSIDSRIV